VDRGFGEEEEKKEKDVEWTAKIEIREEEIPGGV